MKIVHLVSSLNVGGMEHFVVRLAHAQRQKGHSSSVFALRDGPLTEEANRLGVPVVLLRGEHKIARVAHATSIFFALGPQIIHAHNQTSLHFAVLGKRVSRAPIVLTNHGQAFGGSRTPSVTEWGQTDSVIAVSNAVADLMDRTVLGKKLTTIYNGVDFSPSKQSRAAVRAALGLPEDRVVATMVARIDALKGHETLIKALGEKLPLTVLLAGDGAKRAEREQQAASLGLGPEHLRFLGFRSDVPDLLAASDLFLLPSLTEGLPLSVLEAMSHGLPIIATRVGGIPELVTENTHGLLIKPEDSVALANAIASLTASKEQRQAFGAAARLRVETEFTFSAMADEYTALYLRLLETRKTRNA
jgi:L-malate glycosyltransferase